ncbi:hypothetical protein M0812_25881 [Anaeramoeba flamelloides]|uniref:Glycosyl transferase family 1 domain-containing protein n=1 Tax=Anaeramoeba flamelloides TaxID=1746091 RepID=A0AAV7YFP1_9EUKA|nr:hypothetical protein M0812_25881 [Anaeramoeba flamelloides]
MRKPRKVLHDNNYFQDNILDRTKIWLTECIFSRKSRVFPIAIGFAITFLLFFLFIFRSPPTNQITFPPTNTTFQSYKCQILLLIPSKDFHPSILSPLLSKEKYQNCQIKIQKISLDSNINEDDYQNVNDFDGEDGTIASEKKILQITNDHLKRYLVQVKNNNPTVVLLYLNSDFLNLNPSQINDFSQFLSKMPIPVIASTTNIDSESTALEIQNLYKILIPCEKIIPLDKNSLLFLLEGLLFPIDRINRIENLHELLCIIFELNPLPNFVKIMKDSNICQENTKQSIENNNKITNSINKKYEKLLQCYQYINKEVDQNKIFSLLSQPNLFINARFQTIENHYSINDKKYSIDEIIDSQGIFLLEQFYFKIKQKNNNVFQLKISHPKIKILISNNDFNELKICIKLLNPHSPNIGIIKDLNKIDLNDYQINLKDCSEANQLFCSNFPQQIFLNQKMRKNLFKPIFNRQNVNKINILWEGTIFDNYGISKVAREILKGICFRSEINCTLLPLWKGNVGRDLFKDSIVDKNTALQMNNQNIHIFQHWPPRFSPTNLDRKYVVIQPWEFGAIPLDWVEKTKIGVAEIWVPSQFNVNNFISSGIEKKKVHKIFHGVDPLIFHPNGKKFEKLKTKKSLIFLFLGGDLPRKGIDILLDAYISEFSPNDDVCLLIHSRYSVGFQNKRIEKILKNQKKYPEIEYLTSDFTTDEIVQIYHRADYLIHPFRAEGFGLTTIEALSSGLPLIVSKCGPVLEFLDEKSSFFIPTDKTNCDYKPCGEKKIFQWETNIQPFWCEPKKKVLQNIMKRVYNERNSKPIKRIKNGINLTSKLGWDPVVQNALNRIYEIYKDQVMDYSQNTENLSN